MKCLITGTMQIMLLPLNLMQNLMFCPKYLIRNNYISPNNFLFTVISVLGLFSFIAIHIYLCYLTYCDILIYSDLIWLVICLFEMIFYSVGFTINTAASIVKSNDNVDFVIIMQEVVFMFKYNSKKYTIRNWMSVIFISVYYVVCNKYCFVLFGHKDSYFGGFTLLLSFDINIIYAISAVNLLQGNLIIWNKAIINSIGDRDRHVYRKLFHAYDQILKCYNICKRTFSILVSIYFFTRRRV